MQLSVIVPAVIRTKMILLFAAMLVVLIYQNIGRIIAQQRRQQQQEELHKYGREGARRVEFFATGGVSNGSFLADPAIEHAGLIEQIRKDHLIPPAPSYKPYNFVSPNPQMQSDMVAFHRSILDILDKQKLSVECGALDGETLSHSLDLEKDMGWKGLLIEASPSKVPLLKEKNRKAWVSDVCVGAEPHKKVQFLTKIDQKEPWKRGNGKVKPAATWSYSDFQHEYKVEGLVDCYSLYLVLKAVGTEVVDLLVLDVEGEEYNVLSTYPFHLLPIRVIAVEYWLTPQHQRIVEILTKNGYELVYGSQSDYIFVLRPEIMEKYSHLTASKAGKAGLSWSSFVLSVLLMNVGFFHNYFGNGAL